MTGNGYPALGFDPAPGTVSAVQSLAENLQKVASDIGQAHDRLDNIGRDKGIWQGKAAQAFQQKVGPLPDYLQKANQSLGDAGKVLGQWGSDLSSLQHNAQSYESEAAKALRQLQQAQGNPDLRLAGQDFPDQASLRQAQSKLDAAEQAVSEANEELDGIRRQAKRLLQQHDDLVQNVVKALNRAKDEAIPPPGLLDRIGQALSDLGNSIKDAASKTWDFIKKHADDIKKIGDILSTVGGVLSVATAATAEIPVVGEVMEAASTGVNAAAAGTHLLAKAAGADVSWKDIGMDGMGVIPGGSLLKEGSTLLKVAPKVLDATKDAKGIGQVVSNAAEAGSKVLKDVSGEQVGKWGDQFTKVAGKVGPMIGQDFSHLSEATTKVGGTVLHATEEGVKKVGEQAIEPFKERAENVGKDFYHDLTQGKRPPSAGQVFSSIAHGTAA